MGGRKKRKRPPSILLTTLLALCAAECRKCFPEGFRRLHEPSLLYWDLVWVVGLVAALSATMFQMQTDGWMSGLISLKERVGAHQPVTSPRPGEGVVSTAWNGCARPECVLVMEGGDDTVVARRLL